MSKNIGVKFNMKSTEELLRDRGLLGEAQVFVDSEVMRCMEPYLPFLSGVMVESMKTGTEIGSGEVVVNTPYAHKRLKIARNNGLRGPNYFERMKADHKDAILDGARRITGGKK